MYSRKLRRNATLEEKELLGLLKKYPYDIRFQRVIPPYIVDFVIRHILIIELDGKHHEHKIEKDSYRDTYLKNYGYEILRFSNSEFKNNKKEVLSFIIDTVKSFSRDRVFRGKKRINRIHRDYETNWSLYGASQFKHKNYDYDRFYGFKREFAGELNKELQGFFYGDR